MLKNFEVEEH